MRRLATQLDANFGPVAIDEVGGIFSTNQGHVVTRHQQFGRQQRAIRGSKDQNVARHSLSARPALKEVFMILDFRQSSKLGKTSALEHWRPMIAGLIWRLTSAGGRPNQSRWMVSVLRGTSGNSGDERAD